MRFAAACFAALLATSGVAMAQTTTPAPGAGKVAPPTASAPATATAPAATAPAHAASTTASAVAPVSDAAAKQKCGTDTVVWGSPSTKVYHTSDSRYYGKTKKGAFLCLKDATAEGYHAPKTHAKKAHAAS